MPLKNIKIEAAIVYRNAAELIRWLKEGRFDLATTVGEVKQGFTSVTAGTETIISNQVDEFLLGRALFACQNTGDGNLDITLYAGGVALSSSVMQIRPGEISVFRLPDSNNAADKVTCFLSSGTVGRLDWIIFEDDPSAA